MGSQHSLGEFIFALDRLNGAFVAHADADPELVPGNDEDAKMVAVGERTAMRGPSRQWPALIQIGNAVSALAQ